MKQTQIPGTEREEIPDLQEAAEAYRKTVADRMALQRTESEQKAHLQGTIHRFIDEGVIELPDEYYPSEHIIYRYEDEDGRIRDVKFRRGKESVKVNLSPIQASEDE